MDSNQSPYQAIEITNLCLTLTSAAGPVSVLRNIDLSVKTGEIVGIVGPSGSGKTSLLMVMSGLENATEGIVKIAGTSLKNLDEDALARFRRDNIGIVFQSFHLVPTMTALENVALPLEFSGCRDSLERATEELNSIGLKQRLNHYPSQLSGGEQQRVALARAFVGRPSILLADEPTGSLDRSSSDLIIKTLFGLQAKYGTTLILVTHAQKLASRCSRIVHLADGRALREEGAEEPFILNNGEQ